MRLVAPGLTPEQIERGAWFLRMISPAFLLQEVAELTKAVHNAHHRYVLPGLTMLLGNVLQAAILIALPAGQAALAWVLAVDLAALLQAIILIAWIPAAGRGGLFQGPAIHPALRDLWRILGPAALGVFLLQIAGYVERAVLSFAPVGSIATIMYARKLTMPIQTILAASVALPLYVQMSRAREHDGRDRIDTLGRGIEINLFLFLPITAYVLLFAPDLIAFAFRRGLFGATDVAATVPLLRIGVLAVLPASLLMVLRDFLYASSGTWPLAAGGMVHLIVTGVANLTLATRYGILWIPIGIVVAAYLTFGILLWIARGRLRLLDVSGILRRGAVCLAAAGAAFAAGSIAPWLSSQAGLSGWTRVLVDITGGGIAGLGIYALATIVLGHPVARSAWERIRRHG
jgi:putative peptidoglycan lipid II flippase